MELVALAKFYYVKFIQISTHFLVKVFFTRLDFKKYGIQILPMTQDLTRDLPASVTTSLKKDDMSHSSIKLTILVHI